MSEENVNPSDQATTDGFVAPDDFSFFDVLEGVSYPEDEVTVVLDEKAAYRLQKVMTKADALERQAEDPTQEEIDAIHDELASIRKDLEKSRVTFYLRGVDGEHIGTAKDVVDGRFEDKKKQTVSAQGQPVRYIPESEAQNYARMMNAVVMSMYVVGVKEHRTGKRKSVMTPDEMAAFYDKAPQAAKERLSSAIAQLRVDSDAYEAQLDEGFFPKS